jgi:hypothetical protein
MAASMLADEMPESIYEALVMYTDPEYPDDPAGADIFDVLPEELGAYRLTIQRQWCHGDGHEKGVIFTLQDPEWGYRRHFQITGWYSSWGSSTWDPHSFCEVVALEQTVTFYARKDGYK